MGKPKKKITKEDKLAKDRQRKKEKYGIIKNNPELYAIQKEKERKRYLMRKEQKKITSIKEMTPRAQREQRKKWRINSTKYLKKKKEVRIIERILLDNSPPPSDTENANIDEIRVEHDPLQFQNNNQHIARQAVQVNSRIRRLRYNHMKEVKNLKRTIDDLNKKINTMQSNKNDEGKNDSIEKRVDELVSDVNLNKREEIKKRLIFEEVVSKNLKEEYKNQDKKSKKKFAGQVIKNRHILKKYQILQKIPFPSRTQDKKPPTLKNKLSETITRFLEDDANSSVASGKREYVKYKGEKKQKRYLREKLGILHGKFCMEELKVGYSTFCKFRPPWIVSPNSRDTCGCKVHANIDLLLIALKKTGIINLNSSAELLKYMCCLATDEKCLERKCLQCCNKVINYEEFSNEEKIVYYQWLTEKQKYKGKNGEEKTTKVTIKKKLEDYPKNLIQQLEEDTLPKFLLHAKNIALQYASIKELKKNMKNDEILIHIDFSENYCLKYNAEIQSFHFGGSRGQVSLHTGVLYYKDLDAGQNVITKSFCTVSKCLQHDAASVWAHLIPVLDMAKEVVFSLKAIHFLSDSPTSQYRNKFIFYIMTQLEKYIPGVERVTWNYQEAGHGKGAPDGIGAVIKRAADQHVFHGGDVDSFERFVEVIGQNVRNVRIIIIEEETILNTKFPSNIPTFKGTMKVHQAIWCISLPHTIAFRKLSCFVCQSSYIPCHHGRHLGVMSSGIDSKQTKQNETGSFDTDIHEYNETRDGVQTTDVSISNENCEYNTPNSEHVLQPTYHDIIDLNLDSPTIQNNIDNIDDSVLLSQIDDQAFLGTIKPTSPQTTVNVPDNPKKVTILSDVKFDWQNYKFNLNSQKEFHQAGQEEFKKFLTDAISTKPNIANDEILEANTHEMDFDQFETSQNNDDKENDKNRPNCNHKNNIGDWVVVQYQIKTKVYAYIGKIKEVSDDTNYTVMFLKKSSTKCNNTFSWPNVVDEDTIDESRIFCTLQIPVLNRRGQYLFKKLPELQFR